MSDEIQQPPISGPSAQTWLQETAVGGTDVEGENAPVAVAVAPQGVGTTRTVPTLAAASNTVSVTATTGPQRVLGATPQRRRVTLVAVDASAAPATAYGAVIGRLNVDGDMARSVGLPLMQGVPVDLSSAGEVWAYASGAVPIAVSFWSEIDKG